MKRSDIMYTQYISTIKGHRQQDIPLEKRDIKQDRKQVVIIKRKVNNGKA